MRLQTGGGWGGRSSSHSGVVVGPWRAREATTIAVQSNRRRRRTTSDVSPRREQLFLSSSRTSRFPSAAAIIFRGHGTDAIATAVPVVLHRTDSDRPRPARLAPPLPGYADFRIYGHPERSDPSEYINYTVT